mmetsp:Transcript_9233/g.18323  ORF Transcript_9233/g.18323 Transcript_9233/m.18323 type:complete len:168 (+) Transcript_9233:75-578(+)
MNKTLIVFAAIMACAAAQPQLKSVGDMKAYLLDVGNKVDLLDIKLDLVGSILNLTSDVWEWKVNKTTDALENIAEKWDAKKNKTSQFWDNKLNEDRGVFVVDTMDKGDVWDALANKLGLVKNKTADAFETLLNITGNIIEWKVNKTMDIVENVVDFAEAKKNKTGFY